MINLGNIAIASPHCAKRRSACGAVRVRQASVLCTIAVATAGIQRLRRRWKALTGGGAATDDKSRIGAGYRWTRSLSS